MKSLEIFWVRHSVSKANITPEFEKMLFYFKYKDPAIVDGAERGSCSLGDKLDRRVKNNEMVFCSEMRRAIQTAILMFPEKLKQGKLKVIPGVQETGPGPEGVTYKPETNKKYIMKWCDLMRESGGCNRYKKLFKTKKDVETAVNKLYSIINNKVWEKLDDSRSATEYCLIRCLTKYLASKNINKIAIVSHSNYIRDEIMVKELLGKQIKYIRKDKRLYNNQILDKKYKYDSKKIEVAGQEILNMGCVFDDNNNVSCYKGRKQIFKEN